MSFNKINFLDNLTHMKDFLSKEFEGIKRGRDSSRTLITLKNNLEREIKSLNNKDFIESDELVTNYNLLEQAVLNIEHVTRDWSNPLTLYDEDEQLIIDNEVLELNSFLMDLISRVKLYTDDLIETYLERDKELKEEYKYKGTLLFYTNDEIIELVENLQKYDIENANKIDSNLTNFYESLLAEDKYFITIGDYDVIQFEQAIRNVKGKVVREDLITKLIFHLNKDLVIDVKRNTIHDEDLYITKLEGIVRDILKEIEIPIKNITLENTPYLIKLLEKDVQYRSDFKKSITLSKLVQILNKYPLDIITNLEREIELDIIDTNKSIYITILDDILFELGIKSIVSKQDISNALEGITNTHISKKVNLLYDLINVSNNKFVKYKISTLYNDLYLDKLREFYKKNELLIMEEIEENIESDKERSFQEYINIITNLKSRKRDTLNLDYLIKGVNELGDIYEPLGISVSYNVYEDNTNRIYIEIVGHNEVFNFDLHNRYLYNLNTGSILYSEIKYFNELQNDYILNRLEGSDLYNEVSIYLCKLLINKR